MQNPIPLHIRQNAMLALMLLLAAYLSIAAIAAIPALQEDTTASRNDVAQLRTLLTSEERQFKPLPAAFFQKDPFEQLAKDLSTNSRVIEEIAKGRAAREHAHLEYENAQQRWDDQVKQARTHALTTFERNADRKGNFERGIHYEALIESKPEA